MDFAYTVRKGESGWGLQIPGCSPRLQARRTSRDWEYFFFVRKLRSFNVCSKVVHISFKSVAESAVSFAAICRCSSNRASDSKKLNKQIKNAGSVLGTVLDPLELIIRRKMLHELLDIMDNTAHPLHNILIKQQSVFNLRLHLYCNKDLYRRSFLPIAITL